MADGTVNLPSYGLGCREITPCNKIGQVNARNNGMALLQKEGVHKGKIDAFYFGSPLWSYGLLFLTTKFNRERDDQAQGTPYKSITLNNLLNCISTLWTRTWSVWFTLVALLVDSRKHIIEGGLLTAKANTGSMKKRLQKAFSCVLCTNQPRWNAAFLQD